ncbi:WGxxGxxG family protein [Arsenicicoccus dermatophilus]|uniref:WGxxGxxG family protein n=1 Tax=Arsenicicoccus dermatophilus TaxID=1076331 RepID=UPI001F4CDCC2|nr:WGxxGxxG family protein [Arsenicicoccus dermatophilus]MCH8612849.1 hypothetical protein [Arsenicicoccus dermatophilus]
MRKLMSTTAIAATFVLAPAAAANADTATPTPTTSTKVTTTTTTTESDKTGLWGLLGLLGLAGLMPKKRKEEHVVERHDVRSAHTERIAPDHDTKVTRGHVSEHENLATDARTTDATRANGLRDDLRDGDLDGHNDRRI